jgi:hypothetical protein
MARIRMVEHRSARPYIIPRRFKAHAPKCEDTQEPRSHGAHWQCSPKEGAPLLGALANPQLARAMIGAKASTGLPAAMPRDRGRAPPTDSQAL